MPLLVSTLRTVLREAQDLSFLQIVPDFLELEPALELFKQHLANALLDMREVTVDVDALHVTGTVTLVGQAATAGSVLFLADEDEQYVVGFCLDVALLPDGPGLPEELREIPAVLERLRLGAPHLVLGIEPGGDSGSRPRVGLGLEVLFPTPDATPRPYVWGYPPLWPGQSWQVGSNFADVPIPDLDSLLVFAGLPPGYLNLPPDIVELATRLALTALGVTFVPEQSDQPGQLDRPSRGVSGDWLALWLRVDLDAPWKPLPGIIELDDLHAEFTLANPLEDDRHLATVLGGRVTLAEEIVVDVGVALPDRSLSGILARPAPLGAMLRQRFPDIPVPQDLTVTELALWAELADGPGHGYGLDLTLQNVWHFADGIELTAVVLTVADRGGIEASLTASWQLGEGTLDVTGTWTAGAGWTLTARALGLQPADVMSRLGITVPEQLRGLVFDALAVTIDSAGHFSFECAAVMPVGDVDAQFIVTVDIDRPSGTAQVAGVLRLTVERADGTPRMLDFIVAFGSDSDGSALTAAWTGDPGIGARELAGAVGLGIPAGVPATLLPTLTALALRRDRASGRLLVASATLAGGGVALASVPGTPRGLVLLVQAAIPARLSDLPLVGGQIPPDADIGVTGIQLLVTRTALSPGQIDAVNRDLEAVEAATGQPYPRLPAPEGGLPKGAALTVPYEIAGQAQDPLTLAFGGSGSGQLALRADGLPASGWVDIGRSFGPLHVYRIGLGYDNSKVLMMFDAALGAAGLTIGVRGLGIALDLDTMDAQPRLEGLSVDLRRNPLHIAGAFVNRQPPPDDYRLMVEGMLVVEMPRFGALALGAYQRRNDGMTSLFAFGRATGTFGGPPPFRVTGFALGFGFNSGVRVPEQEEIADFPLVSGLEPGGDLTDDPLQTLALLTDRDNPWVRPVENQIWLAGGLDFTSFEFVQARVLLLLEAGNDLTLALIGRASASFPKKGRAYARIGVDLRVVYQSARGELAATAQLVDSYVIDPACVLTGGFAFYLWSGKSKYAGDFVLTVGGYHPAYKVPGHFPAVPRLGFTWSLGSTVSITGAAYFALTPNAVMAGGMLDVRYRSGNVEAWLTAKADILIQWAPLHFRAGISVTVGAKVKLLFTVRGELGASLDLWGPPTGGTVTAKFVFIKVTVKFGASLDGPRELTWPEFATQLLPAEAPLTATALTGLMADADADPELQAARIEAGEEPWLLDPAGFSFAVSTVVPTKRVRFNNDPDVEHKAVDIRPMGKKGLDGLLTVTVDYIPKEVRGQHAQWQAAPDTDKWIIEPQYGRVPFSLWGDPAVKDKDALKPEHEPMLTHITGLRVTVPAPAPAPEDQDLGPIAEKDLAWERLDPDAPMPLDPDAQPTGSPVRVAEPLGAGVVLVADALATLGAASARTRLHSALAGLLGHDELPNGTLGAYAEQAGTLGLDADPLLLVEDAAPPAPEPVVFVLDDTARQALAVDPETGAVIGRIAVGQPGPYLAATSADGSRLYAVGAEGRQISVLDTGALRALAPRATTLSGPPTAFAVTRDGARALVARPSSWAAGWVDLTGNAEPTTTVLDSSDARSIGGLAIDVEAARLHLTVRDAGKAVSYDATDGSRVGEAFGPSAPTLITPAVGAERVYVYGASATGKGAVQVVPVPGPQYRPWGFDASGTELRLLTDSSRYAVLLRREADGSGHVITFYERQGSPPETTLVSQVGVRADPLLLTLDPLGRRWVLHSDAVSVVHGGNLLGAAPLAATPTSATFTPDAARAFVTCADATIAVVEVGDAGPQVVDRWTLPPGTVPSAALFTVFTATASEGAAR